MPIYARSMRDVVEAPIDNWLASFDGRVLEVFTPYREGSMRYHAALMVDCRIAGTTLTVDFQRPEVGLWPFRPEQLTQVTAEARGSSSQNQMYRLTDRDIRLRPNRPGANRTERRLGLQTRRRRNHFLVRACRSCSGPARSLGWSASSWLPVSACTGGTGT